MRCIVGSRCACLNHLCDHMIELRCVSARDHWSSETLFQIPPGIPGNGATSLRDSFIGIESLGMDVPAEKVPVWRPRRAG